MGNEQSTADLKTANQYQNFIMQYSKEREINHNQFGTIRVYDHLQNEDSIFIKRFLTKSSSEYDVLVQNLKKRKQFDQPQLFRLIAIRMQDNNEMCSNQSQITSIFEYFEDNLEAEIKLRKNNNSFYDEGHLWIMIQQCIDPLTYLQENKLVHGDIKPRNIYLDQQGTVKMAEYNMIPGGQPGFYTVNKDKPYLSPILLAAYSNKNMKPVHNHFKSDVFSLGLSILHATLLEESFDCLDFINGEAKEQIISNKLRKVRKMGFSQVLVNFIKECLKVDEQERPDFLELKGFIDEFRDSIYNLQPFYKKDAPQDPDPVFISVSTPRKPMTTIVQYPVVGHIVQPMYQTIQTPILCSPIRKEISYNSSSRYSPSQDTTGLDSRVQKAMQQSHDLLKKVY
ncbi:hypothetical protein pb186bvf_006126 [Paramecium bursaria]